MKNFSVKLPEKYYCGFQQREEEDNVPLGFMTPWGNDAAFAKRQQTVDNWASPYWSTNKNKLDPTTFDNELLAGFKLGRSIKRNGWNSTNVVVRIEDPRGFEVEISVDNLCRLAETNTIINGEIMAQCIWGREGGRNILLAENSQPYLDALENTDRSTRKISMRDVKPGYRVRLANGTEGRYLGKAHLVRFVRDYNYHTLKLTIDPKPKYICEKDEDVITTSSLRISDILDDKHPLTPDQQQKELDRVFVEMDDYSDIGAFLKPTKLKLNLVPTTHEDLLDLGYKRIVGVCKSSSEYWKINSVRAHQNQIVLCRCTLSSDTLVYQTNPSKLQSFYNREELIEKRISYQDLESFTWYKIGFAPE